MLELADRRRTLVRIDPGEADEALAMAGAERRDVRVRDLDAEGAFEVACLDDDVVRADRLVSGEIAPEALVGGLLPLLRDGRGIDAIIVLEMCGLDRGFR